KYDSYDFPAFVYASKPLLANLKSLKDCQVTFLDGNMVVKVAGLNFNVTAWEELYILNEVFVDGVYNYVSSKEYVLIDIGMNVATTSLFFASKSNCLNVFAFEPFDHTIKHAANNLQLNPLYSDKIRISNVALGFPARTIEVEYAPKYKGSVGIKGTGSHIKDKGLLVSSKMVVEDVADHFTRILNSISVAAVVKIDCEGAEYAILGRLHDSGILSDDKIKCLMIEWHYDGPGPLESILNRHGFQVISLNPNDKTIGMLYACK
ncbi:MAG: FkbM family methyltransferase, partial [Bacteroidota bacterium]